MSNGLQMQQLIFEDEVFSKVSSFYREKDGKYQNKKAEILVRCINSVKEEKICEVSINLSSYIGRGAVKDSIQLSGSAYFLDFEIEVEPADPSKRMTIVGNGKEDEEDSEESDDSGVTKAQS
jgi:hypothetical protein